MPVPPQSEFQELRRVMAHVQPLLVRNGADTPLLHRQGPEEDLNGSSIFVISYRFEDIGLSLYRVAFNLGLQKSRLSQFLDRAAERGSLGMLQFGGTEQRSHLPGHIRVPGAGIEERPERMAINIDAQSDSSHL